jgi:RNA polymerase sigma factor (sigma-70 family)
MTAIEFNYQLTSLQDNLSRFAYSLTLDKEDAMDLLQETMLKALKSRNQFMENTNFRAWTFTIMKNTFINTYRRHMHQRTVFDRTPDMHYLSQNQDTIFDVPDSQYSAKELKQMIENLEVEYRAPLQMHIEGYKYKEIADDLGLNLGTVKSRIFFARQKLMRSIESDHVRMNA